MGAVWYTLLNYNGRGAFSNINFHDTGVAANLITVKITVDGGAPLEVLLNTNGLYYTINRDYAGAVKKSMVLDWGLVSFETSLKIEWKHNLAVTVKVSCFYQTYA